MDGISILDHGIEVMALINFQQYIIVNSVLEVTSCLSTYMCTYDIGTCLCVHFEGLIARYHQTS